MNSTQNFLTPASIGTFAGATSAVWIVGNVLRVAFKRDWQIVPLLTAIAVSFVLAQKANLLNNVGDWLLALLNGGLLYLTAAGIQQAANADIQGKEGAQRQGRRRVSWLSPWIRIRGNATDETGAGNVLPGQKESQRQP